MYVQPVGPLRLVDSCARALRHNLTGILIESPRLRDSLDSLLYLRVRFQQNLKSFLHAEAGHEHFLLDLALDPVLVFRDIAFREAYVLAVQVISQLAHYLVIDCKFLGNRRTRTEIVAREAAYTRFSRIENVGPEKFLFKLAELRCGNDDIGRDAPAAGYLPS